MRVGFQPIYCNVLYFYSLLNLILVIPSSRKIQENRASSDLLFNQMFLFSIKRDLSLIIIREYALVTTFAQY